MKIKYILFILFTLFSVTIHAQGTDDIKSITKDIRAEEKQLIKLRNEGKSVAKSIAVTVSKIENYNRLIRAIDSEKAQNERKVEEIRLNIIKVSANIKKIKKDIARSNIFVINNLGYSYIKVIATAKNPESTIKTLEILEIANGNLFKQIHALNEKTRELELLVIDEKVKLKNISDLKADRLKALKELEAEKVNQKNMLTMIKHDEAGRLEYLDFLKFQRKTLEDEIKLKREEEKRKSMPPSSFSRLKGSLELPLNGKIIEQYGDKFISEAGVYIFNHGVKIEANVNSDIYNVAKGEVIFAEYMKGFDNLVVISHGSAYYTVYGNMSELIVVAGQSVLAGDIIGRVPGGNYLYFEIRLNDEALNPNSWLVNNKRR